METTLCLASALEILNSLRVLTGMPVPVDPAMRRRPVKLERLRASRVPAVTPDIPTVQGLLGRAEAERSSLDARFAGLAAGGAGVPPSPDAALAGLTAPLHVLSGSVSSRRSTALRVTHLSSAPLPPRSLVRVLPDVLVSSPEHLFMQASRHFDTLGLAWLASELCAVYAVHPRLGGAMVPCWPLTSVGRIASYLEGALQAGAMGARKAQGALRYAVEAAASPGELSFALLMTLPYAMGGRAIPKPQLNWHVDADHRVATLRGRKRRAYSCDMCWPEARLVVEYDGDDYHFESERRARDYDKRSALEEMGYRVVPVSTGQAGRLVMADDAIKRVAAHLGIRNRANSCGYDWQARRSELRRRLRELTVHGLDWAALDDAG